MNSFKKVIIPISLFFITMIVFSIFAEIDEVVRGEGKIVVATNPVKIQHFEGGIIEKIYVKDVEELLSLKTTQSKEILYKLVKKNILQKIGKTKGSYYILNYWKMLKISVYQNDMLKKDRKFNIFSWYVKKMQKF